MQRPFDVDASEYPFKDHWMSYRDGMIHYVDEGQGPVILLLHGNPTWSYLYRNVIKELSGECRLIALDYPGLGMSRAPSDYGYTPKEHSEAVTEFIRRLDLKDFVLVVQDWGGPIGLGYAVRHRENLRGVVVMNTWAWPATLPAMKLFSFAMGGWPFGYWLQTRRNFFAKKIVPHGIYHSEKITDILRKAYTDPFPTPKSRKPTWVFPRQIRKARPWLAEIEAKLPVLSNLPAQILWGMKDSAGFPPEEMAKWQGYLKLNETESLDDASHYVQEDRPDRVVASIRRVLERTSRQSRKLG
ncbi:alpha/beta fold hydrolase [Paenibacillus alginolyticus]|uniref:Alpha/beta fold hydrolase n=1 Tax=Paenibacillus alginolyticus TaxID=59839 RepID=A0ABT4GBT2_9BACL|nr:alpha/beta fold hydrolase [Paenibacillus alginolyticus]MCY9666197.1 alpha/beta fold hydrolase [Paenibacillus alginolyticus]MCY9693625.1 alpha/beta fold hydrolase [Paenibacillus alginolyticus]MEC0142340.1 alpha/beta fold hydrolase [Paenibacillus alginolyticus]